jgi:hypothetical protein
MFTPLHPPKVMQALIDAERCHLSGGVRSKHAVIA